MRHALLTAALILLALVGTEAAQADPFPIASLNALDKVTGRVTTLRAPLGETQTFGHLEVTVQACDKPPPEDPPEAKAWLEIVEAREGVAPKSLFKGWMFASSPGLNALEHPVYDIWVADCVSTESSAAAQPDGAASE
ncbi:MAG: DUF2155 domain-containing protein [Magnetospiraceae bacterium]